MNRKKAKKFQEAKAKHTKKAKLSSADWYSCENQPLFDDHDDVLIICLISPMELHFNIGIVNGFFDTLFDILRLKNCEIGAYDWSNKLGMTRDDHQGGRLMFNGRQCKKLLQNTDLLINMLKEAKAFDLCGPLLDCMATYSQVQNSCFGFQLHSDFKEHIKIFANSYKDLVKYVRSLDLKLNVTNKVHGVCVHVSQFIELQQARGLNFGLAYYTEQGGIHKPC